MTDDGEHCDGLVTDAVDDEAEEDDAKREWPHPSAVDSALLRFGEIETILQHADRIRSHAKDEGCGYEGDEAGPEEFHIGFT